MKVKQTQIKETDNWSLTSHPLTWISSEYKEGFLSHSARSYIRTWKLTSEMLEVRGHCEVSVQWETTCCSLPSQTGSLLSLTKHQQTRTAHWFWQCSSSGLSNQKLFQETCDSSPSVTVTVWAQTLSITVFQSLLQTLQKPAQLFFWTHWTHWTVSGALSVEEIHRKQIQTNLWKPKGSQQ